MSLATSPAPAAVRARARRRGLFVEIARHWADYLYVAPAIVTMFVVIGYPMIYTIYLSFFETPASSANWYFVGLDNYTAILSDGNFWQITRNTLYWTIASTLGAFLIGFGAALVIHREFIGRGIIRGLLLIPYVISFVVAAYVWRWLYHSDFGLISGFLRGQGLIDAPITFLDSRQRVMPALIVANIWKEFPFAMILILAGLQTVPEQLQRAARVDGASTLQTFWHVTVPHLKGVLTITWLLLFIGNLNSFTLVWIMTGGGPANASHIWITEIYNLAFNGLRYGYASAFSVILFLIMLGLGYFYVRALAGDRRRSA